MILYENKILKTRGPKKMQVLLPPLDEDELPMSFKEVNLSSNLAN
jgi:hypothetical protein